MKFEFDLNDIFEEEENCESWANSVKKMVTNALIARQESEIRSSVKMAMATTFLKIIEEEIAKFLPALINESIDKEYSAVDCWGRPIGNPTSIRKELVNQLEKKMKYDDHNYNKNDYTSCVNSLVSKELEKYKTEFKSKVNDEFIKQAFEHAVEKMKELFKQK